jgi:copper chaperone
MHTFIVSGMTCGGCTNAITRAIQAQDANATVQADLSTQKLEIDSQLDKAALAAIVADAGFPIVAQ